MPVSPNMKWKVECKNCGNFLFELDNIPCTSFKDKCKKCNEEVSFFISEEERIEAKKLQETKTVVYGIGAISVLIVFVIFLIIAVWLGIGAIHAKYNVWSQGMQGQAELNRADWNRQIAIREAKAKKESASLLAEAEIERAKGVAQANKIIGDGLKNNEEYLRYLWIDSIKNTDNQIIYVPTESNLPVLEAGRLKNKDIK